MEDQKSNYRQLLYVLLFGGFFVMALRYAVAFRFMMMPLAAGATIGLTVYLLWNFVRQKRKEIVFRKSTEGIIDARLRECDEQMQYHIHEIADIEEHIADLEQQLRQSVDLPLRLQDDTEQLIESFRSQLKLRVSKLAFFEMCKAKLEQLLHQHELAKTLEFKKKKLKRLQEDNYDDMAKMEEMRANVEYDTLYLDTIENLSRKLQYSNTYTDVERLRAELDEMTKSLEKF